MAFLVGSSVFWEQPNGGGTWSAVVVDRFTLGGLCTDIWFDGIVRPPTTTRAIYEGPGQGNCYRFTVPAAELKVRQPEADDAEKRLAWETAAAAAAATAGVTFKLHRGSWLCCSSGVPCGCRRDHAA